LGNAAVQLEPGNDRRCAFRAQDSARCGRLVCTRVTLPDLKSHRRPPGRLLSGSGYPDHGAMTARRWSAVDLAEINHDPSAGQVTGPVTRRSPLPESQDRNVAGRTRKAGGIGGWSPGRTSSGSATNGPKAEGRVPEDDSPGHPCTAKEATARLEGELAALEAAGTGGVGG